MIIPGTYIEVRAEGLIRPGPIAIGNVGIVGTASRGRLADPKDPTTVYLPSNIGEARDIFGQSDAFEDPKLADNPLTLIRAMELVYANKGKRIFAVRVAKDNAEKAIIQLPADNNSLTLTALVSGSGYSDAELIVKKGTNEALRNVSFRVGGILEVWRDVDAPVGDFVKIINGEDSDYDYRKNASTGGKSNLFKVELGTPPATGNIKIHDESNSDTLPKVTSKGTDGADAESKHYKEGLAALENQNVHIIVLAGQGSDEMANALKSHVENAAGDLMKRERIGVFGSTESKKLSDLTAAAQKAAQDEGRLVYVGPGLKVNDSASGREVPLPGSYAAAAVAGLLSSLDPHASSTNKTIIANGVEAEFDGTQLEELLLGRVLALESRNGIRIVRGLTTSTNTAWQQITTRRIVDFAKFGVRASANPFIGKLNNERVRQALKGSVNSFLADMIDREMLIAYELEVSATRDQQIRGIALVTMTLQPTFSIDFVRVVMYLQ